MVAGISVSTGRIGTGRQAILRAACGVSFLLASLASPNLVAGAPGPSDVEQRIRRLFPGVLHRLAVANALKPSSQVVLGRKLSGFALANDPKSPPAPPGLKPEESRAWEAFTRRSMPASSLRVFLPGTYDQPFVAGLGGQRVVLKALGTGPAPATTRGGLVAYANAYEGVDSLNLVRDSGSEEFLLVREETPGRFFEYEVIEQKGIADIVVQDGKVHFVGMGDGPEIELDQPWLIEVGGEESKTAIAWEIARGGEGSPMCLRLRWKADGLKYPILIDPSFVSTGSLVTARYRHTATLLPSGKVLVAGGYNGSGNLSSAELYDSASGIFAATGALSTARSFHTATLLPSGKILVVGGAGNGSYLSSAELYDPATGTFTATGPLATARQFHTATLLPSGKVLVAGGDNGGVLSSAELYDAVSGVFTSTGPLATARYGHTATLLPSGNVLVTAGYKQGSLLDSAELYDPATGTFTATGPLATARQSHTATLLPSGKVLVGGATPAPSLLSVPNCTTRRRAPSRPRVRLQRSSTITRRPCCLPAMSSLRGAALPSCTTRPRARSRPRAPLPSAASTTRRPCCLPARPWSRGARAAGF